MKKPAALHNLYNKDIGNYSYFSLHSERQGTSQIVCWVYM